mmetsp:Transcript_46318/g.100610  ORF Transcript_46318/g.100610 Transcript_46318/m.100610 type:complete len:452 (+) Transcript_46318:149-1504(+)
MTKAFFKQTNSNGISLHDHLTEVIHTLLASKDQNALENLENISLEVKSKHFNAKETGLKNAVLPADTSESWCTRTNKMITSVDMSEDDEGLPNLYEEAALFEWAGVGLAKEELYRLFLAMTRIKSKENLKAVRFFGKILGTEQDYYVVEGTYAEVPPPPSTDVTDGVPPEPPGTGLNTHVYFVANSTSAAFTRLPDVLPQQVVACTTIKKYLTGNLDAPVNCFPPFPGAEASLLRAQIARIAAATVLVPAGKFKPDDEFEGEEGEAPPIVRDEEYEAKSAKEMLDAENWCHFAPGVLKIGRCTNPPKPEAGEDEEEEAEEEEQEEEVAPLNPISSDPPVSELLPEQPLLAWSVKVYHSEGGDASVAIAKSNRWPGALSAATKTDKCANIYIGYGCENIGVSFTPLPPPPILFEAADVEEQPDVLLAQENEVLKSIEEAKMEAEAEAEEDGE